MKELKLETGNTYKIKNETMEFNLILTKDGLEITSCSALSKRISVEPKAANQINVKEI